MVSTHKSQCLSCSFSSFQVDAHTASHARGAHSTRSTGGDLIVPAIAVYPPNLDLVASHALETLELASHARNRLTYPTQHNDAKQALTRHASKVLGGVGGGGGGSDNLWEAPSEESRLRHVLWREIRTTNSQVEVKTNSVVFYCCHENSRRDEHRQHTTRQAGQAQIKYTTSPTRHKWGLTKCNTIKIIKKNKAKKFYVCLLYTSPSPRDKRQSRMPSSA